MLKSLRTLAVKTAVFFAVHFRSRLTISALRRVAGIQLSCTQLLAISDAILTYNGCRLLVFGLGNDSYLWQKLNRGGSTVFLENIEDWRHAMQQQLPSLNIVKVEYHTKLKNWKALDSSNPGALTLDTSPTLRGQRWDVILVDAPVGCTEESPGRMQSICSAAKWCDSQGTVYVDDCDREAEFYWSNAVLGASDYRLAKEIRGDERGNLLRSYVRVQSRC